VALYRQFDVALIALLRPDYEIQNAYYGFVQRMMDMAYLLPTFLLNSTLPMLSERDARGEDTRTMLGKTLLIVLIIGIVSLLFAALWARPLTDLLTTPAYLATAEKPGSDTALLILSVPMFCNGIILFGFYTLLTKHAWRPLVASMFVGVVIALISNILLIPQLGFVGAAITSVIVHVVLSVLLLPQALSRMPARFPIRYVGQLLCFAALLAGILWFTRTALTGSLVTGAALAGMGIVLIGLLMITGLKRSCLEG
jgi:O-antigen/teichoic acid export membrane protein